MARLTALRAALEAAFAPEVLEIVDRSSEHAAHFAGADQTHFDIHMVSAAFADMSRLQRERAASAAVQHIEGLHALSWRLEPVSVG